MSRKTARFGFIAVLMICLGVVSSAGVAVAADEGTPTARTLGAGNADGMVKLVFMLKRRPGMSREEFLRYYEQHHARLGEKYVPNAVRYVRRFIDPMAGPSGGGDADYDVLTELWFANQGEVDKAMKLLSDPKVHAEIEADEKVLFDRAATRMYMITERDSTMNPTTAPTH